MRTGSLEKTLRPTIVSRPSFLFGLPLVLLLFSIFSRPANAQTFGCTSPMANDIVCENSKPGNPSSDWDVDGAGDLTIQGFAIDISVNQGQTINFKIATDAAAYTIDIYRMGYYGGMGARKVASILPSAKLPQNQPSCLTDANTNLVDCGNWAISASWTVPSNATSGIYFAHLIRTDTGGDSHIVFIVRNDSSHSDILFQTADETWQAYNGYGKGSLYGPNGEFGLGARAFKVSYNRPVLTRGFSNEAATWVFGAEYPMVRWLESNGYDVTYFTGIDAARNGSLILNHKMYMDSGHDEYWSGPHRANVEAARNAGVNMAFFSGNEVFWKTRLENSIDGTNTPDRTLVCYKETLGPLSSNGQGPSAQIDPNDPPTWTGTWRDPTFSPPVDAGKPENALTGTIFEVNGLGNDNPGNQQISVPSSYSQLRFWRNTAIASLAPGATYTFGMGTLGYEWDIDADNGSRPPGAFRLSSSTYSLTVDYLLDFGAIYGPGTATHHMMTYRAPSGALVFGSGTIQWSWALDSNHDDPFNDNTPADPNAQQATVNLFADMGVQPATLQGGLLPAIKSTDTIPPTSVISSPAAGADITGGSPIVISGTATDSGGGVVAGIEVSTDGGNTWHPADGGATWSYAWSPPQLGNVTIKTRAVDDSGNIETPSAGVSVTIIPHDCSCDAWSTSSVPSQVDSNDGGSIEIGVKFRADFNGYITGVRFYKAATNTGTHIGNLWSSTGSLLASAVFTNETASGWQQVSFNTPVLISANTTYIASYFAPKGHYSADSKFFLNSGLDNPPIHLLQNGVDGPNGVYSYGSVSTFPSSSFQATNYWVDIVYMPAQGMPGAPPALVVQTTSLSFQAGVGLANPPAQSVSIYNQSTSSLNWTATPNVPWLSVNPSSGTLPQTISISVNASGLAVGNYTGTITITASGAADSPQTISVSLNVTNFLLVSNFANQGLQGWVVSPLGSGANWSVVNGAAQYSGAGNSQIYAGDSSWTDYSLNVPFRLSSMQDWPGGIRGRVNPATGAGYMAWVYPALGEVILYKASGWTINSGLTQLAAATAAFDTANYHNLTMVFSGTQIQVQYDGNTIISVNDSTYTNGLVALEGLNQIISFGNVLATSSTIADTDAIASGTNSMSFSANITGPNPSPQTTQITAGGSGTLVWTAVSNASWLSVFPTGGTTPGTLQVSANISGLGGGSYNGTVTILSLGSTNLSQVINVTLTVVTPPPAIATTPSSLNFIAVQGQASPAAQALAIVNGGFGSFGYTISTDSPWLSATPSSGSTPGSESIGVNISGLAIGTYSGNVIITASGVANSPQSIPVTVQVLSADMTETFADLGNGWIVSPMGNAGGWTASNGVYSYNGSGLSQACTGNAGWTDYAFDAQIKLSSLANWPGGIRARVNPSTGAGYVVWLYPGSGIAVLYRIGTWNINDSSLTALAQAPVSFDTTAFHDLRTDFRGGVISVFWDGTLVMSATDSTYSSGFVCLDADNQPISYSNINVDALQGQVNLDPLSSTNLVFNAVVGSNPPPQTLTVTAGGANVAWTATSSASWLVAAPSTTLTPGKLTVSANSSAMAQGSYTATISLSAPGAVNSPITINVTLAIKTGVMSVAPSSLTFFGAPTMNPVPQTLQVTNLGSGNLGWSATFGLSWLGVSPTSGSAPSTITVAPNTSTPGTGAYSDTITISSPDVTNSPIAVPVTVNVGNLLFTDNFSQGAGNWTVGPLGFASGWSVANDTYSYNGEGPTQSWAGSESWTDYTVAVNFQLASLNDYPGGLRGRLNTSTGASYGAWVYPAQGVIKLFRIDQWNIDAGNALLGQSTTLTMDTNVHNLRLAFQGSTIQVYYDNALVVTATDSTYTQGAIALDVSSQPISFSNVAVISLP